VTCILHSSRVLANRRSHTLQRSIMVKSFVLLLYNRQLGSLHRLPGQNRWANHMRWWFTTVLLSIARVSHQTLHNRLVQMADLKAYPMHSRSRRGQLGRERLRSKVSGIGNIQSGEFSITRKYVPDLLLPLKTIYRSNDQSISSTRGVGLLQAFLYEVHQHHSRPPTFPPLKEHIVTSCAYRVSTSGLSTNGRNTPLSTYPSPPGTPPLRHLALSDRLQRTEYELKEKELGKIGRDWRTSDAFEALVRKENSGIGQVWLDGQSVR
jgi:hypothetical protein